MQISVVIITKNESENLALSLPALSWCEDIVVVDDFSDDDSCRVAESFGARIFSRRFDGFGTQKQFAVSKAVHNWVLNIDADEVMSEELISEISRLKEDDIHAAYRIPVRHVFLGSVFQYGKESNYPHLRLFNREKGNFDDAQVHEKVITSGKTGDLKGVIMHHSYKNLQQYFIKFNKYTEAGALKLKKEGKSRSLIGCLMAFPVYFIKHYFLQGNILNGRPGFIWSYLSAWYHTVKYLKLYELNRKP